MNAHGEPVAARQDSHTESSRLREIPYNYTSFSDREIVIRLLGAPMWALLGTCAASGAPAARRACSSRCWATSGSSSAIRTCRTTCSTTRAGALLVDAMRHRLNEIDKRRAAKADADAERDANVAQLDRGRPRCGRRFST